jgi:hypothetical protein
MPKAKKLANSSLFAAGRDKLPASNAAAAFRQKIAADDYFVLACCETL